MRIALILFASCLVVMAQGPTAQVPSMTITIPAVTIPAQTITFVVPSQSITVTVPAQTIAAKTTSTPATSAPVSLGTINLTFTCTGPDLRNLSCTAQQK